jgi:SAM-dependent methyltransferase
MSEARWRTWQRLGELEEAYLEIAAVQAAQEVGLFERIGAAPATLPALAADLTCDQRGLGVLVDLLTAMGLLDKDGDRIRFSPGGAAFLDPASESYYGDTLRRVTLSAEALGRLGAAVRTGEPLGQTVDVPDTGALWAQDVAPVLATWREQRAAAQRLWETLAVPVPAGGTVVDLGCGSGFPAFGVPGSPTFISVDWHPAVLEVTTAVAARLGIADRVRPIAADLRRLELPPSSVDLVHAAAVLYFYPFEEIDRLLARAADWLRPGGYLVSRHLLADAERASATEALRRAVQLFLFHPGSHVPTTDELTAAASNAGLTDVRTVDGQYLIARKPTS